MRKASYKKQKKATDKLNKHTNYLYSAKIYNGSQTHQVPVTAWGGNIV